MIFTLIRRITHRIHIWLFRPKTFVTLHHQPKPQSSTQQIISQLNSCFQANPTPVVPLKTAVCQLNTANQQLQEEAKLFVHITQIAADQSYKQTQAMSATYRARFPQSQQESLQEFRTWQVKKSLLDRQHQTTAEQSKIIHEQIGQLQSKISALNTIVQHSRRSEAKEFFTEKMHKASHTHQQKKDLLEQSQHHQRKLSQRTAQLTQKMQDFLNQDRSASDLTPRELAQHTIQATIGASDLAEHQTSPSAAPAA